jgi:hypothetical protein
VLFGNAESIRIRHSADCFDRSFKSTILSALSALILLPSAFQNNVLCLVTSSIDLQKMNWKFRTGVREQTGVSLKEPLPDNPRGEYPREHQDTGK